MALDVGVDVSRETIDRLKHHLNLVLKWTKQINLIAPQSKDDAWFRHTIDSAQIFQHAPEFTHWVDLGSGGGFPGIVCAAIAKELQPTARFTFVESDQRKAAFLRTAIRELDLSAKVLSDRIEVTPELDADVVSARALSPLPQLLPLVSRHLATDGTAILLKGQNYTAEIDQASVEWTYTLQANPSMTDERSRILILKGLNRAK